MSLKNETKMCLFHHTTSGVFPELLFFIWILWKCIPIPQMPLFSPLVHHSIRQTRIEMLCQMMQGVACSSSLNKSPIDREKQLHHRQNQSISSLFAVFPRCCIWIWCHCGVIYLSSQEVGLTNGTPVDTSSPASASSLFNRLQLDDDLEADARDPYASTETRDLFVTVDDPKKHVSTMETYITYRVSSKVCYWLVSW